MSEEKIIYACREHIDIAIDDYVNFEEKAPEMKDIKDDYKICTYCSQEARYILF